MFSKVSVLDSSTTVLKLFKRVVNSDSLIIFPSHEYEKPIGTSYSELE